MDVPKIWSKRLKEELLNDSLLYESFIGKYVRIAWADYNDLSLVKKLLTNKKKFIQRRSNYYLELGKKSSDTLKINFNKQMEDI